MGLDVGHGYHLYVDVSFPTTGHVRGNRRGSLRVVSRRPVNSRHEPRDSGREAYRRSTTENPPRRQVNRPRGYPRERSNRRTITSADRRARLERRGRDADRRRARRSDARHPRGKRTVTRFNRSRNSPRHGRVAGTTKILGTPTADRFHNKNSKIAIMVSDAQTRTRLAQTLV